MGTMSENAIDPGAKLRKLKLVLGRGIFALLCSYFAGRLGFNVLILPAMAALWIAFEIHSERYADSGSVLTAQKLIETDPKYLKMLIPRLPPWVLYPEFDRVTWLNDMIAVMWPYINKAMAKMIPDVVNPVLESVRPSLVPTLSLEMDLGQYPPTILGIKTLPSTADEIYMDMLFQFIGKPNITLLVGMVPLSIQNLEISGKLRVVLAPLVKKVPILGGVSFSFIENPRIDFSFEAAKLNVLGIPGLSDMLTDVVKNQVISTMMLWPKKIAVPFTNLSEEELRKLNDYTPDGILTVFLESGNSLFHDIFVLLFLNLNFNFSKSTS